MTSCGENEAEKTDEHTAEYIPCLFKQRILDNLT